MSEHVKELDGAAFKAQTDKGVTLVDFWAPWCGPCRMLAPILDKVGARVAGKAVVAKVNVDDNGDLAAQFGVRSIPTLILFKDGQVRKQVVGVQREDDLVKLIEAAG